jgi:hypothetical protein
MLLPPSKLGEEPEPSTFARSYQLLPPSGRARTEGLNSSSRAEGTRYYDG